jgi:hypothetical protein
VPPAAGLPKPPPPDALVLAKEDRKYAVALAASPISSGRVQLTATVIGPTGSGVDGLDARFRARGGVTAAHPCGAGCYTASTRVRRRVTVAFARPSSSVTFDLPARLPAPSADGIVRRSTAEYRRLRSVEYRERLSSGVGSTVVSLWKQVAPNRLEYRIRGGASGIVIGGRRWDKIAPGARWTLSPAQALRVPEPIWGSRPTNIHLLGTESNHGRRVYLVSLLRRDIPAWFTIRLDAQTLRPISLDMVATAHFMHHDYLAFNRPLRVRPPR